MLAETPMKPSETNELGYTEGTECDSTLAKSMIQTCEIKVVVAETLWNGNRYNCSIGSAEIVTLWFYRVFQQRILPGRIFCRPRAKLIKERNSGISV